MLACEGVAHTASGVLMFSSIVGMVCYSYDNAAYFCSALLKACHTQLVL